MTQTAYSNFTSFHQSWYQKLTGNVARARNTVTNRTLAAIKTGHDIKISPNSHLFLEKLSPYQRIQISRKIASLSATPRPGDASAQKNTSGLFVVSEVNTGFSISYKIVSTTVYVLEIVPNPKLKGESRELPALYLVKKTGEGEWALVKNPVTTINTQHAAVNGQSNNLDRAKSLMGTHVNEMFKQDIVKEYTLFHNPSDGGFWDTYESSQDKNQKTTAVSKQFADVLANVQENGNPVKWLAHSQGGLIFTEAARYHWQNNHTKLTHNTVQFNAGANNETITKGILRDVDIKILDFNNHPFDPVPNLIGGNAKDWVSLLGSTVGLFFVFTDDANKSPHTLPYKKDSSVVNTTYGIVNKTYDITHKSSLVVQSIINSLPI